MKRHLKEHPDAEKKFKDLEEGVGMQKLDKYMSNASISCLDKKIINFIVSNAVPFSIVDEKTFKSLLSQANRDALKGRHHYSDIALPRIYRTVKEKLKYMIANIKFLSFTCDIWSGPTESFIR